MSYQVLARKWRPPDFDSLVGQDHVVTALRNALADGRIAQAYLFSGIRGVGKTTAARVLAKALNCLSGPDGGPAPDPCNECASCEEINRGGTMDVIEVDAATYSKVEQVRELTETLRYGPARGRYKVVVLDEVHRLSRQAFDALLKIVEEPPPHLVFIFATTEIDAVPATILSRCQEFQFRRVASPVVAAHLRRICDAEEIDASDAALRLIARAGEGSVRDAVALLDQMSTFGHGTISDDDAAQLLAGFDAALFGRLLAAILEGEAAEVSAVAREVEQNGWDPHHVFGQFLGFCRDGLHLAMGGDASGVDLPAEEAQNLADLVRERPGGYQGLLQVLQLLLSSEATVKRSEFGAVALEIAWLRAAELPRVQRIESLLAGGEEPASGRGPGGGGPGRPSGGGSRGPSGGGSRGSSSRASAPRVRSASQRAAGAPVREAKSEDAAESPPASSTVAVKENEHLKEDEHIREVQETTESAAPADLDAGRLGGVLELLPASFAGPLRSTRLGLRDGELVIVLDDGDRHVRSALSRKRNAGALEDALRTVYGPGVAWRIDSSAEGLDEYVSETPAAATVRKPARPARPLADAPTERAPRRAAARSASRNGSGSKVSGGKVSGGKVSGASTTDDDRPPVDLYDEGDGPRTAAFDFSPSNGSQPNGSDRPAPTNGEAKGPAELDTESRAVVESLPTVQLVQELFRGKIRSVRDEAPTPT